MITTPADTGERYTFRELVFSDLGRYRPHETPSWLRVALRCLVLPGLGAAVLLRAQQRLSARGHTLAAQLVRSLAMWLFGADLVPGMKVGPGLYLPHPAGVVIGGGLTVGANVIILQGVTAGARVPDGSGGHEFATIGDGAIICANAVLVGGVRIGANAQVGANTVVLSDVEDNAVVFGVPARRVGTREVGDPPPAGAE